MARQLDILVLEPYYGGFRREAIELLARTSRHRWIIYKLPARRLERRLNTAATWFHQQLSRSGHVSCDLLFTSDAMNLAEFLRLSPQYGNNPIVSNYYGNPLAGEAAGDAQARLAMLATANCSTEIWFNSLYHMKTFLGNAAALYDAHPELGGKEPLRGLVAKSQLMHPPVPFAPLAKDADEINSERRSRSVCLDNRDGGANALLERFLRAVVERKEPVVVHVIGKPLALPEGTVAMQVDGSSDEEIIRALRRSELFISAQPADRFDPIAMRAMALGCIPVLPKDGFHSEFLPPALHRWCLFEGDWEALLNRVMDLWYMRGPTFTRRELDMIFERYAPIEATRNIDHRIEHLAVGAPA